MTDVEAGLRSVVSGIRPPISVFGDLRCSPGYANDVWFFDSSVGRLVAKIRNVPEEDPEQIRTYARTMELLKQEGFPTPDLIFLAESCEALGGRQVSILRHSRGVVAADAVAQPWDSRLAREFGRTIGRLHSIELPARTIWRDDRGAPWSSWHEVVLSSLDEATAELSDRIKLEELPLIDAAAERIRQESSRILPAVRVPRLVHRDLHPGNLLVEAGKITALLDFEMVREWDPAYDFIKIRNSILAQYPESEVPFLAGYREHAPTASDFEARVRLYEGLYCLLSAVEFLDGNDHYKNWHNHLRRWFARGRDAGV